jgi:PAS domain S-box-containing protein
MKILIGDSDKVFTTLLHKRLSEWGYDCSWTGNSEELISKIPDCDILLLSRQLKGAKNGLEVCRLARELKESLHIVMITGSNSVEDLIEGIQSGADDYISKPCNMQVLRVRLQVGERIVNLTGKLITDQEKIESINLDLTNTQKQLQQTIRHNQLILNSIPAFYIALDQHGRIFAWNREARDLFGRTSEEVLGEPIDRSGIHWDTTALKKAILEVKDSGESTTLTEVHFKKHNGMSGYLQIMIAPIEKIGDDSQVGVIITGFDYSEQMALQEQLASAQKVESIGHLAAGIAHEINSPLQFIGDNTRFLEEACNSFTHVITQAQTLSTSSTKRNWQEVLCELWKESNVQYFLDELPFTLSHTLEGIEQVSEIVRAMRTFTYTNAKAPVPYNLNEVILGALTLSRNGWKNIMDVSVNIDPSFPEITGYASEISQVVLNLVMNAADAIAEKNGHNTRERGALIVTATELDNFIQIEFADTGIGISSETAGKVFERFFTTKSIGKGTGQGLAICKKIIEERHNGKISFQSIPGNGTCFTLLLPTTLSESSQPDCQQPALA